MTSAPIEVEAHLAEVLAAVRPLAPVRVPLANALGRVLAADVVADTRVPAVDNSSMDGYAVRRADVAEASAHAPADLLVVAEVAAGSPLDPTLAPGQAARIMTGAPVPSDADAVVPVEDTAEYRSGDGWVTSGARVRVTTAPAAGAFVRRAGSDLTPGSIVLAAGARLTPYRVGAAAAAGVGAVDVFPAPRVAVIATGDELVEPGVPTRRGQLADSNSALLRGVVSDAGGELVAAIRVGDDPAEFLTALDELTSPAGPPGPPGTTGATAAAAAPDVIICTGGVSVGAHDVVKAALAPGGRVAFRRVSMQPGKPQAFGRLESGALCFGLPGNPVSVAVSFEVFVRPALQAMQGLEPAGPPRTEAIAATGWRTPPGRRQYMPIVFDGDGRIRPATAGGSGSHLAGGLARAEGFAIVPADTDEVRAGESLPVMLVAS
ncbi:molybdopterin molybdotransferase MoeA [Agromyces silvae]|uniref:molybdopterin molybdotransferase MoeA n=1 Tax=Agromyces silvae TaxID=3388266 RepID=UPI00280C119E|nr:molybdopterin molybdotransferase MoeA [Agromyces protaetiae]